MFERTKRDCPFCSAPDADRFYRGQYIDCLWDAFPVAPGHALIVTRRHIPNYFATFGREREELLHGIDLARTEITKLYRPDGWNIGVNIGDAAGQTVPHVHIHVIPRYAGDVADPRGGVRHVISARGNYLSERGSDRSEEAKG